MFPFRKEVGPTTVLNKSFRIHRLAVTIFSRVRILTAAAFRKLARSECDSLGKTRVIGALWWSAVVQDCLEPFDD